MKLEKTTEHHWSIKDDNDQMAYIAVSNGQITGVANNLDTLEDYKLFHQALGEAIAVAEVQDE